MYQAFSVVEFLHRNNIWGVSLKLENFLIMLTDNVSEFKLNTLQMIASMHIQGEDQIEEASYPPELLQFNSVPSPSTDIWSLGILLQTLITRKETQQQQSDKNLVDLIDKCLQKEADKRIGIDQWPHNFLCFHLLQQLRQPEK